MIRTQSSIIALTNKHITLKKNMMDSIALYGNSVIQLSPRQHVRLAKLWYRVYHIHSVAALRW